MRSTLFVAMLAMCLIALQCTATENGDTDQSVVNKDGIGSGPSEDQDEESFKHLRLTLTLPTTKGTPTNGAKAPASPPNQHTNKPGAPNTPTTEGKPATTHVGGPTNIAKSNPGITVTLPKETPPAPKTKDLSDQQASSTASHGNEGTSTDKHTPGKRVVTKPSPLVSQLKHDVAPSGKEQSPPPAITLPSSKSKVTIKNSTTATTTGALADKGPVPEKNHTPTSAVETDNTFTTTGTTITKHTKTTSLLTSVSSTTDPAMRNSATPSRHLPELSKALQSLDNKDSSIGSSSLFALASLATLVVMAVAPAS